MKLSNKPIISIIASALLTICSAYSFGTNNDSMSWSDYEMLYDEHEVKADYDDYLELVKNPQCIEFESDVEDMIDIVEETD